jgi:hypothetical protein
MMIIPLQLIYTNPQCHQNNNMSSGSSSEQISALPAVRLPSPMFTGRDSYLQTLHDHFSNPSKPRKSFLLHGMGGIGKTQICLQFIEQSKAWYIQSL